MGDEVLGVWGRNEIDKRILVGGYRRKETNGKTLV